MVYDSFDKETAHNVKTLNGKLDFDRRLNSFFGIEMQEAMRKILRF